ncbi:early endosome antigen 1-like [Oryzias latipes]|uniref:early endosome antigen 1-like n=1 Tax=Oryzias latipes TaxID=8090 RepID=UPI000CE1D293|nr:early endosome antigen 1-like [Oryzias latipes]
MHKDVDKRKKEASKLNKSLKKELDKLSRQLQNQINLEKQCERYQDKIETHNRMNERYQRQTTSIIEQLSDQKTLENKLKELKAKEALLRKNKLQMVEDLRCVNPSQHNSFKEIKEKEVVVQQLEQETEALEQRLKEMQVSVQKKENFTEYLLALRNKENCLQNSGSKLTSKIKKLKRENKNYDLIMKELEAEQKTLEEKNRQLKKLEEDHEEIKETAKVYKLKISQMKERNLALSKEIHQTQTAIKNKEDAEAELLALWAEKNLLKNNTVRLEREIRKFKIENGVQMHTVHAERDALELKIQKEKESIQQRRQEVCALQQELQVMHDATQQKEELKEELSKLEAQKKIMQNSSFKLRCELQELQNTGGNYKLLKQELEVEQKTLKKESQKLKSLKKQYEDVTTDVKTVKLDIKLLRTENQALLEEIQSLDRVMKTKAKAEAELGGLRKESSHLKNSIQRLKEEIQIKKAEFEHLPEGTVNSSDPQALFGTVKEERFAVELLKREATHMKNQLRELEQSSTFQGGLRLELSGVLAQKKSVEENNSRLKKKIQKLQEEHQQMIELKDEVAAQSKALDTANAEEKELEEEYNRIQADIVALQYSKSQLAVEKQALSEKIQEKNKVLKKKEEIEAELCALRKVSSSLQDSIEQIKQEIERENAEFDCISESSSNELPDTVISTLLRNVSEEKLAVQNLEQEADVLRRTLQDMQDSVQQKQGLEMELYNFSAEKRLVQDSISEMKRKITNLQNTLDEYSEINAEVLSESKTLRTLHQQQRELEKEHDSIQAKISAFQVNNSKLAAENQTQSQKPQQTKQKQQKRLKKKTKAEEQLPPLRIVTCVQQIKGNQPNEGAVNIKDPFMKKSVSPSTSTVCSKLPSLQDVVISSDSTSYGNLTYRDISELDNDGASLSDF